MFQEAIILSGGLGTRLRERVPDLPKTLAPVAGKPFIHYVVQYLLTEGIDHIIFSLGYKQEMITDYIQQSFPDIDAKFIIEEEPLGTGGAIHKALQACATKDVVVVNGDTLFQVPLQELYAKHNKSEAICTLALKPMQSFDRYGTVDIDSEGRIIQFEEKRFCKEGIINGGVYAIDRIQFNALHFPEKFSFENAFLEKYCREKNIMGVISDTYFIDIGIPDDYEKANLDLQADKISYDIIDNSWTLFLDRDGVINEEKHNDYIHTWDEFTFYDGVLNAMHIFSNIFKHIIVVTNQRGVGKGITTVENLDQIHQKLIEHVTIAGGKIDKVYYCPAIENDHPNRKPNPGMGVQAIHDFPEIDPLRSIMIGNNMSDMQFGKSLNMKTVFLTTTQPKPHVPHLLIDASYPSLIDFAHHLHGKLTLKT